MGVADTYKPLSREEHSNPEQVRLKQRPADVRFNFAMGLLHGMFFTAGTAFSEPTTVLPVFLSHFTVSQAAIGLFSALMKAGGVFPQLFVANKLETKPRKKPVLVLVIWVRAAIWLALGLLAYFCPPDKPIIVLATLIVLLFGFSFAGGVATIPFTDLWGKALPVRLRGRFFGHRQLWGGLMAVGAGLSVKVVLANPGISFPRNYAYLFLLSFVFMAVSYVALSLVREPEGQTMGRPREIGPFLRESVPLLWADRNFGLFIVTQLAVGFAAFALPFYVLYGKNELHMAPEQAGILVGAQMAGGIVSNLFWAQLSDHKGNRIVITLTAVVSAAVPLLGLLCHAVGWKLLILVFALTGCAVSGGGIGFTNYLLEIAPEQLRTTYIALHGTMMGLTLFLPIFGGLLIDVASYEAAFLVTMVVLTIGVLLSLTLKEVRNT